MVRIILIFSFLIVNIYGNKISEKNLAVFSKFDGNAVLIKWVIPNLDKNYTIDYIELIIKKRLYYQL